jgi:F-type H+-transporting ATPase subunit c
MLQEFKMVGGGLATIALSGVGTGIGFIFGGLLGAVSRNPSMTRQLFNYAILGFALTEAIALFAIMIVFLILF